jgi:ABC-type branched-subunit amino acid transport system substrate-binding protein
LLVAAWSIPSLASAHATPAPIASTPGVTPTDVLIGSDQPLTGPASVGYSEIAPAARAFFDFVNAHGGVRGRTITYTYLDDASDPATAAADEKALAPKVFAYFNGFGVAEHAAIVDDLNAQGVPDLFVGSSCECWNEPRQRPDTFAFGTDYPEEGRLAGRYVARTFPTSTVAYIWENSSAGCCQRSMQELDTQIPGTQVVTRQAFTTSELPTDRLLPQVRAAQAAGAQVLVLDTIAPQAVALALLDAASVGYHPMVVDTFHLSADPSTLGGLIRQFSGGRASQSLENGLVTQDYLPSASDAANPWIALFRQVHDTYEPAAPFDNMTVYGMAAAFTFTRAMQAAGPHPTRHSIVAAVDLGEVNFGGPGLAPFDYSLVNHAGYGGEQIGTVETGGIVLTGPVFFTHDTGPIITLPPSTKSPSLGSGRCVRRCPAVARLNAVTAAGSTPAGTGCPAGRRCCACGSPRSAG